MSESSAETDATAGEAETEQPETEQPETEQPDAEHAGPGHAGAEQAETFTNRAARRAKGKSATDPAVFSKGQRPVGRGAVQNPRQYGRRRSG